MRTFAKTLLVLGGLVLIGVHFAHKASRWTPDSPTASTAPIPPNASSSSLEDCPINKVHPGMALEDVRSQLAGYVMDYRGERQDQQVYFVNAKNCHAFLDFNAQDGGLDAIDYGLGFDKIQFRKAVPSQPEAISDASSKTIPPSATDAKKGYPVPESTFVDAYVLANYGKDDLDKEQLETLAHDEYRMGQQIDTQTLLLGGELLGTRGKRAMDYLERLRDQAH